MCPERLELVYARVKLVHQVYIDGNSCEVSDVIDGNSCKVSDVIDGSSCEVSDVIDGNSCEVNDVFEGNSCEVSDVIEWESLTPDRTQWSVLVKQFQDVLALQCLFKVRGNQAACTRIIM